MLITRKRLSNTGGENTSQDSLIAILQPLADELITEELQFPKTVIFTKLNWCGFGYEFIVRQLLIENKKRITSALDKKMVSQYHAPCTEEVSNF